MQFKGIVIKGDQEGRKFGFPTVNIEVENNLRPGVYSGYVEFESKSLPAAIVVNPKRVGKILEAHIISFQGDLYGKEIKITVEKPVRDWVDFPDLQEGKKQIEQDIKKIIENKI